jgi:hypothetical protein
MSFPISPIYTQERRPGGEVLNRAEGKDLTPKSPPRRIFDPLLVVEANI